ncbi:MAG TPA: DUF2975 domain-containing protein [Bacteroidia bacterium]|nr:DUF2975 domain-containing protein [Bacteroidia bacterium]
MKERLIILLQGVIALLGIVTLVIMIRFPLTEGRASNLNLVQIYFDPLIVYGYLASIPFFIALYSIFQLLRSIRQNKGLSPKTVRIVRRIKYCAIALSILIVIAALYIKLNHNKEDDPAGFLAICMLSSFGSIAVAVLSVLFEKKLQKMEPH